ncbi:hypothetical protein Vretifemale_19434 [Volvox reticuliferus]|uniref:Uncharacterized protein n=1 Tax=Volvox reticuliferus TaxID=1737510 RepID=A0A8J4D3G4_9CHLO|nr:hypothetical protein Vretifemale_19434 [Volvox reticuliferus]
MSLTSWVRALLGIGLLLAVGAEDVWETIFIPCINKTTCNIAGKQSSGDNQGNASQVNASQVSARADASKCFMDTFAAENGLKTMSIRIATLNLTAIAPLVKTVNNITRANGIPPVNWTLFDPSAENSIKDDIRRGSQFHAYVLTGQQSGDMAYMGFSQDLSSTVAMDTMLDWSSLLQFYRSSVAVFGGQVMSIPISGFMPLLYYRLDIFEKKQVLPPRTWDELIKIAERFNGTDLDGDGLKNDFGICMWQAQMCPSIGLPLVAILASLVQTHGLSSGLYIEPYSGESVLQTVAWENALTVAANLSTFAPPAPKYLSGTTDCSYMPLFGQGRCAMAIAGPNQFKIDSIARRATPPSVTSPATNSSNSSNSSSNSSSSGGSGASPVAAAFSVKGRIGAAIFPGSSEVLDWTAKKMVPCDATRCPHAVQYPGGLYVNAPPFAAMVGFAAFINKKFTPVEQLVTYNLISQVSPYARMYKSG